MHVDELCRDIQETHVYKVCLWKSRSDKTTYVFIGRTPGVNKATLNKVKKGRLLEDEKALVKAFGQNWKNKLGWKQDVEYVYESIYRDDNVAIVKKKLAAYLGFKEQDIYAWVEREVVPKNAVWRLGLATQLCRGGDKAVSTDDVLESMRYLLGKEAPASALKDASLQSVAEYVEHLGMRHILQPLELKRMDAGFLYFGPVVPFGVLPNSKLDLVENQYESSKLLESLRVRNNTIHIALRDDIDAPIRDYFFRARAKGSEAQDGVIEGSDKLCDQVRGLMGALKPADFNVDCRVGFLHLRCNEGVSTGLEPPLDEVFKRLSTSEQRPFLKHTNAIGKKTYKLHKTLFDVASQNDIDAWIELTPPRHPAAVRESLTFKLPFKGGLFATLILYPDYHVDVKFHHHKTLDMLFEDVTRDGVNAVNEAILGIRAAVIELNAAFAPIEKNFWLRHDTNAKLVNLVTSMRVECRTNNPSTAQLKALAAELFPYLAVEEVAGEGADTLVLSYKRIDDYSNLSNVVKFLNRNHALTDDALVEKLQANFFMSPEGAKSEVDKWRARAKKMVANQIGWQFFLRPKDATGATIKLRKTGVAYKVVVDGVTNVLYQKRITKLVKVLLAYGGKNRLALDDAKMASDYDALMLGDEGGDDDIDALTLSEVESEALLDDTYDEFDLGDVNFDDVVDDNNTKPVEPEAERVENLQDRSRYVLERLKYADPSLFGEEASYSRKCQQVDKRQPIVITEEEKRKIDVVSKGSYTNFVDYGYNQKAKSRNIYICPEIWCPLSKLSLTYDQFVQQGSKCPGEAEPVIDLRADYWRNSKGDLKPRFVGFYGMNQECLPCCFLKGPKANNPHSQKIAKCMAADATRDTDAQPHESVETKDEAGKASARYILGAQYPLEPGRLGLLPPPVSNFFGDMVCGSGSKSTGFITESTACFVRRGVPATSTHDFFIACMQTILGKRDVVAAIKKHLTVPQFLTLNGGKLCSSFVDETKSLADPKHYAKFRAWILTNKSYVSSFNLYSLREHLLTSHTFAGAAEHKDIVREFLIYYAFQKFLAYLDDPGVPKTDSVLLDLFNRESTWLNPGGINIVVCESEGDEAYVVSAHTTATVRPQKPYAFVVKQGAHYYEPLVRITHTGQQMMFVAEDAPPIASLIAAYHEADSKVTRGADARAVWAYLAAMKKKVRFQVLNYDFSLHGFLLQGGWFVPTHKQPPVVEKNATFVFVSDISRYVKDVEDWQSVASVFGDLHNLTKDDTYKIKTVLYEPGNGVGGKDKRVIAFVNQNDVVVPLMRKRIPEEAYLDNMNIFIGFKEPDERTIFVDNDEHKEAVYEILKAEVLGAVQNDPNVAGLFQNQKKRAKMQDLIRDVLKRVAILQDEVEPSVPTRPCSGLRKHVCRGVCTWRGDKCMVRVAAKDLEYFAGRIADTVLRGHVSAASRRLKQRAAATSSELVFGQDEVGDGRASNLMLALRNPYAYLDAVVGDFVVNSMKHVVRNRVLGDQWRPLPYPFSKAEFKPFRINTRDLQNPEYILDVFGTVNKIKNTRAVINRDTIVLLVENRLNAEWQSKEEAAVVRELKSYNPSFTAVLKARQKRSPTRADVLQVFRDEQYWPSEFELMILANVLRVNVMVFARKTLRNPNGVKCIKPILASKDYVFLFQTLMGSHDTYEVITKDENFVMPEKEVADVLKHIKESCQLYYLEAM